VLTPDPATPRVLLYGRVGCHLCDVARDVVVDESARAGAAWAEVDVDTDPALVEEYGELVPVVTVDGVRVGYWRIDAARVRKALAAGAPTA
jgi:hypothetical protein